MRYPKTNASIASLIAGVPASSVALVVRVAPALFVATLTAALVFAACSCSSSPQGKDSEASSVSSSGSTQDAGAPRGPAPLAESTGPPAGSTDSLSAVRTPGRSVPVYTYRIVNTYPHARDAFTQGLVLENGILYEGTGNYGSSTLRKVDVKTGKVLQIRELPPGYFGEGITVYGKRIIQLTWQSHVGFVYDKVSFNLLREFRYPTEGWGLTHDESRLIMSDGTSLLHFLDPETLEETGRIQVKDADSTVGGLNELEYVRGVIYANVWPTERVAMISPQTGLVVGWIELEGLLTRDDLTQPVDVLNGIAHDSKRSRLFVTGKWWPKLFEIEIVRK